MMEKLAHMTNQISHMYILRIQTIFQKEDIVFQVVQTLDSLFNALKIMHKNAYHLVEVNTAPKELLTALELFAMPKTKQLLITCGVTLNYQ